MNILNIVRDAIQYVSEAAGRIFRPADDNYPETGVQPYDGEPFSKWVNLPNIQNKTKG